jgi:toxin-antitoxin system PIN domain toxin
MNTSEVALIDTNVLVYAADGTSEFHEPAKQLRDRGMQGELSLGVCPQILMEFFAVITNPRRVQQPRSPQEAREEVEKYLSTAAIRKVYPGNNVLTRVLELLRQHPEIARQEVFDCYLVATMQANGISRIYTYNQQHFTHFTGIEVLSP